MLLNKTRLETTNQITILMIVWMTLGTVLMTRILGSTGCHQVNILAAKSGDEMNQL